MNQSFEPILKYLDIAAQHYGYANFLAISPSTENKQLIEDVAKLATLLQQENHATENKVMNNLLAGRSSNTNQINHFLSWLNPANGGCGGCLGIIIFIILLLEMCN